MEIGKEEPAIVIEPIEEPIPNKQPEAPPPSPEIIKPAPKREKVPA